MNWIIGDPHGCVEQLEALVKQIKEKDAGATLYCVGDFCDRGPDTRGVVNLVLREGIKCTRGNHDDVMDCILTGAPTTFSEEQGEDAALASLSWFMRYGMLDTFGSYGAETDDVYAALSGLSHLKKLAAIVPQQHHDFFHCLPLIVEGDGFFISHAALPPEMSPADAIAAVTAEKPDLDQRVVGKALIWGRYTMEQIQQDKVWGKTGYFGHTPTKFYGNDHLGKPIFGKDIVLVDTGAVFGNGLTAVCHETKEVITIPSPSPQEEE
jgi:serine/threonine protein phosphatase 1